MLFNEGHFLIDGRHITAPPGEPVIINSGIIHAGLPPKEGRSVELVTILWDYDFFAAFCPEIDAYEFCLCKDAETRKRIRELLIQLGLLELNQPAYKTMKQIALVYELGALLLETCLVKKNVSLEVTRVRITENLQRMLQYIDLHHAEELTLDEVAAEAGMAPTYFSKYFRKGVGIRYRDYLIQCRTRHARDLLVNTDAPVTDIAMEAGFPNVKSLIESFKKYYLTTPKQYRSMGAQGEAQ